MSETLSQEEVGLIVEKSLPGVDCRVTGFSVGPASETPMGFLGEHLKVRVRALCDGERRELSYFVKAMPRTVPLQLHYATTTRAFYKEIQLYRTLFEDLKNAQENPRKWCPRYFYGKGEELFVIEDLSQDGYRMIPERSLMDEDGVRASLKAVATMHAACFIFEEKFRRGLVGSVSGRAGATLGDIYPNLVFETEASDVRGHPGNTFCETGIASQVALVDYLDYSESDKERIRKALPGVMRRMLQLVKPSDRYRNIFVHGDLWANNILLRKGPEGRQDAVIVDFQLARYAPPAHDVMMLLHLVQDRSFRRAKQKTLLEFYHAALEEELAANGLDVNSVLPMSVFLESCRHYNDLGLLSAVSYFQLILAPPQVAKEFMASPEMFEKVMFVDRSEMLRECFTRDDVFRRRMTEALVDVVDRFILTPEGARAE